MKTRKSDHWLLISLTALVIIVLITSTHGNAAQVTAPTNPESKVYKFRIQSIASASDPAYFKNMGDFCERVKALSNGQIELTLFPLGGIVPLLEMFDAIRLGSLDIGLTYGGWWSGKVGAAVEVESGLPYGIQNPIEGYTLFYDKDQVSKPWVSILREVYGKAGIQYIGPVFGGAATIVSRRPLAKLSDFKGAKISESGAEAKFFEMLGAKTMVLPAGELYTGLAMGVVDGAGWAGPGKMFGTYKLMEVAKYVQWPPTGCTVLNLIMNMDKWNSLPDNLKRVLVDSSRIFYLDYSVEGYNNDIKWMRIAKSQYGVQETGLPMAERWQKGKELRAIYAAKNPYAKEMIEIELSYLKLLGYID